MRVLPEPNPVLLSRQVQRISAFSSSAQSRVPCVSGPRWTLLEIADPSFVDVQRGFLRQTDRPSPRSSCRNVSRLRSLAGPMTTS